MAEAAPQHSEEERARREERAAKFGLQASVSAAEKAAEGMVMPAVPEAPPEMQMLSAEDLKQREERAAKWGTTPANPLDSIVGAAPKGAFWEKRRDTAEDEVPRPEAVHIFGVDKLSTEDLLRFWVAEGVPVPTCVEWGNDSNPSPSPNPNPNPHPSPNPHPHPHPHPNPNPNPNPNQVCWHCSEATACPSSSVPPPP